ncbi:MAG: TetR/AcrR family transcriptional regulator [Mogibacterium sp.]|nr:TetR/AcrR family transcriptional regulator [Mogibacterium sp.]
MPLIVDREKVRLEILMAFERCMKVTPMMNVSLRDIAKEAGMSHANLLNYFSSKDDLVVSYVRYVRDFVSQICIDWFATHSRKRYKSNINYLNAFLAYVAANDFGDNRPGALSQIYVLTHYNKDIAELVKKEFVQWRKVMENALVDVYGEEVGKKEAEAMVILIVGTLICNYCDVHTGRIQDSIVSQFGPLIQS